MITPVKKQSFRSNLDPTLPPSKWAGRITPNRKAFIPDPNFGTVKNSPLRPLGAPKYHTPSTTTTQGGNKLEEALGKLHSGKARVVNVGLNAGVPMSESGYYILSKPSVLKSTKRVIRGIGRAIGGLFH